MVCSSWFNCLIFYLYFFLLLLAASYSFCLFYYLMSSDYNFYFSFSFDDKGYCISFGITVLVFIAAFGSTGSLLSWLIFPLLLFEVFNNYCDCLTFLFGLS